MSEPAELKSIDVVNALCEYYDIAPSKAARLLTDFINKYFELNEAEAYDKR